MSEHNTSACRKHAMQLMSLSIDIENAAALADAIVHAAEITGTETMPAQVDALALLLRQIVSNAEGRA